MFYLIRGLENLLKVIAAAALIGMALVTGADVVMRGVFNSPLIGVEEIVAVLAVLATGFGLAYTHSQRSNIGVEFLISRLKKRTRARIRCLTDLAGVALFALITWRLVLYGMSMAKVGHVSMTLELPTPLIIYSLAAGFGCLTLVQFKDFLSFFVEVE
ncbi:TRAP transporter small permease [Maridesulfovibrio bastinii]|uniref:TRAP transporter small permease n=1 Tax=Maridesulfovibrio bastinii TaxID=47157 RepID=UPI00040B494C|nr:TRAP transporter small permease [Maridesulfovibrio bastinii]